MRPWLVPLIAGLTVGGCYRPPSFSPESGVRVTARSVDIPSGELLLQMARPATLVPGRPVVLFASGDGGWHPVDRALFETIAVAGYPVVGIDSREYLRQIGARRERATPSVVAEDFRSAVQRGRRLLDLPAGIPVVVGGMSRGSGLAVVAAGGEPLRSAGLAGVLAFGLLDHEEHVVDEGLTAAASPGGARAPLDLYRFVPRLGPLPVAVLQSTHDHYVPAREGRERFGPDTPVRRFVAIESRGHTFGGAREELFRQAVAALAWIMEPRPGG